MKATWNEAPFPHVLLEDYFAPNEVPYILQEFRILDKQLLPPQHTGTANIKGRPAKWNDGKFLPQDSPIPDLANRHLDKELVDQIDNWFGTVWKRNNFRSWLLSRYSNGQYYNAHQDTAQFTCLIWVYEAPKPFTGGDLIFTDYKYTLECVNNTGVIFPGPIKHEVPPIEGDGRYTITLFTGSQYALS